MTSGRWGSFKLWTIGSSWKRKMPWRLDRVAIAPRRGIKFHYPGCGHLKGAHAVKEYEPCESCFPPEVYKCVV